MGRAWIGTKVPILISQVRVMALIAGQLAIGGALGDEPLAVCARPAVSAGGKILLLDPVDHTPIALLSDPDTRLSADQRPLVLQTVWDNLATIGLPRLRLVDALPEYWVQPASLNTFVRGPESYSGIGTELSARDWAGMPATDRQAYRLDPGLKTAPTPTSLTPPGGGQIRLGGSMDSWRLGWNGVAGRVYQVYHTPNLSRPFALIETIIAPEDGLIRIALPTAGNQGFFRLAEVTP